jgi:hypothetical protein
VRNPLRVGLAATLAVSVTLLLAQAAINYDVEDLAVWGAVFPLHYELYKPTVPVVEIPSK